jgi:hypothetical protein
MVSLLLILHWLNAIGDTLPEPAGHIQGVVVDGTHGNKNLAGVIVVLRAGPKGALEPVAETTTDFYGKFIFENVPLDPSIIYLPGADRDGVHYPGQRLRLGPDNQLSHQVITTFASVESPSPLRAARHNIDILVDENVLKVDETLLVVNPSLTTYVGNQSSNDSQPSLRLSVPPNFERVTFKSEFYGRRFRIVEHQPVTDIPWTPGERELKFSYRIPLEQASATFHRALDLPSRNITIQVRGKQPSEILCNLKAGHENSTEVVYTSAADELPAGYVIELQVGGQPLPWLKYARSGSLVALVVLMFATAIALRRRESHGPLQR